MVFSSRGRSRPTIWVCRARVAVETRVGLSLTCEWAINGIRYASDLPVPVPAWTSRWSPVSMARATCLAISCWPVRLWPPMPATARSSRSSTCCSPAVVKSLSAAPAAAAPSVIGAEGFQFSREAFPDHDHGACTTLLVVQAQDLRVRVVQLADEIAAVVRDEEL